MLVWRILLGVIVSLSFLLGAALYIWTKEEVDKGHRYLAWLNLCIFVVGFTVFAILLEPIYLILLAGVLLLSWFLTQRIKFRESSTYWLPWVDKGRAGGPYWQAGILGAAFAFGVRLASFEAISLLFVAYSLVLASYACRNSDKIAAFKRADKLVLVFLVVFLVLSFIPFSEIVARHTFFWTLAVLAPLAFPSAFYPT